MLARFTRLASCAWFLTILFGLSEASAAQTTQTTTSLFPANADGRATSSTNDQELAGVRCQTVYSWPNRLHRGYFPVVVRLENMNEDSTVVDLKVEAGWRTEDSYTRRILLTPGQRAEFEMLLRARGNGVNNYWLELEIGSDERCILNFGPGQSHRSGGVLQNVMYVTSEELDGVTESKLTDGWADLDKRTQWAPYVGDFLLSLRTFDQLSANWKAYTSLDTVILDLSSGELPGVALLEALASWCRSGGTLIVLGVPSDSIAGFPGLGAAIDERFVQLPRPHPRNKGDVFKPCHEVFEEQGLSSYRFGFGTLIASHLGPEAGWPLEVDDEGVSLAYIAARAKVPEAWSRASRGSRSVQNDVERLLDRFADLPLRTLMAFMVLFALLLGPINFMWLRRKKKPMLLLVSVPVISIGCSIALLLYGVLAEGLDIRSVTRTWAVLDQRNQTATFGEVRRVFAGRSPGEGLRPQVGTLVMPGSNKWYGSHRQENLFLTDTTNGLVLSGDYFPVRNAFLQMIFSDRTSRLRLDVKTVGEDIEVTNALGTSVDDLLLRGPNGEYHALQNTLAPGQSALLVPTGGQDKLNEWSVDLSRFGNHGAPDLMLGTYVARVEEATLRDDCGVEVDEIDGRHILLGILDISGGAF
jgi:hypothetical protein